MNSKEQVIKRGVIARWARWSIASTNRKIFSASVVIALCTIGVKLVALVKEQLVAASFGTSADLDAFIIAFMVPSFFISVITGALNAAFIPTYIRVRERRGAAAAQDLVGRVVGLALMLLLVASLLIYTTADYYLPYVAHNFSAGQLVLTKQILLIVLPGVVFSGINIIWSAVLNANERFAISAMIPVFTPALVLIFLFVAAQSIGVAAIAYGTVCGMVLETIVLGAALLRRGFPSGYVSRALMQMSSRLAGSYCRWYPAHLSWGAALLLIRPWLQCSLREAWRL